MTLIKEDLEEWWESIVEFEKTLDCILKTVNWKDQVHQCNHPLYDLRKMIEKVYGSIILNDITLQKVIK